MDVIEFAGKMCHLKTAIDKYLDVKKAREYCKDGHLPLPPDVMSTIIELIGDEMDQCEKEIIELATKLSDRPEEQPDKKKK